MPGDAVLLGTRGARSRLASAAAALVAGAGVLLAVPVGAEPPTGGAFRPGESLAGVTLGMSGDEVLAVWGERHGVCRDCRQTTWYFNERPFQPEGAGVVFAAGRVVHAFTVWQPEGWETPAGLGLGEPAGEIGATYGELAEERCSAYLAVVDDGPAATNAYYVYEDEVWGFGLVAPGRSPCL